MIVICIGCVCAGILVGIFLGRKQKIKFYEFLIKSWERECNAIREVSHNNTMLILQQLNEFYEKMLKWKG